jgi:hypothetical protein
MEDEMKREELLKKLNVERLRRDGFCRVEDLRGGDVIDLGVGRSFVVEDVWDENGYTAMTYFAESESERLENGKIVELVGILDPADGVMLLPLEYAEVMAASQVPELRGRAIDDDDDSWIVELTGPELQAMIEACGVPR